MAIEANSRAYPKCLIVKEILGKSKARFLCGAFREYLRRPDDTFDLCLASGVLYHMVNPAELIGLIARISDSVVLWTHYYDADNIRARGLEKEFSRTVDLEYEGFCYTAFPKEYGDFLRALGFCGGGASYSCWMTRASILSCLENFGFRNLRTAFEHPDHPNAPSFAVVATKTAGK